MKKKKNKNIYRLSVIFVVIFLFSFVTNIVSADVVLWGYNETPIPTNTHMGFPDASSCKADYDLFKKNNYGVGVTYCWFYTSAGLPTPAPVIQTPVPVTPQKTTTPSSVYNLLAPIGTFKVAPDNIGDYFNTIFLIAIGLCGALAVIMIVIGGIQYMGDESIFGKTEAKSRIQSAIFGLLIALGAFALLNTINPALLGGNINIKQVSAEITPLYDRGVNDPKNANGESIRCTPVLSGPCSVANLTTTLGVDTAKATAMSKICSMESSGTSVASGTDYCSPPGKSLPFSFGLFQVNLAANGILAGKDCAGLFDRAVSSSDAIIPKYNSGFTCSLLSGKQTLYNTCSQRLLNTATNLAITKNLLLNTPKGINNWIGDKAACASAFN